MHTKKFSHKEAQKEAKIEPRIFTDGHGFKLPQKGTKFTKNLDTDLHRINTVSEAGSSLRVRFNISEEIDVPIF
jgi:hypothetical protein